VINTNYHSRLSLNFNVISVNGSNEMTVTGAKLESTHYHRTRTSFSFAKNTGFTKGRGAMIYAGNQIDGKGETPTQRRGCTLVSVTSNSGETQKTK